MRPWLPAVGIYPLPWLISVVLLCYVLFTIDLKEGRNSLQFTVRPPNKGLTIKAFKLTPVSKQMHKRFLAKEKRGDTEMKKLVTLGVVVKRS